MASTTTTTADVRKIFEASRILGLSPLARACLCRLRRRSQPGCRESGDRPPTVEDLLLDDGRGTSTMDDPGLACQGPSNGILGKIHY
jgi:hypothetical protein